jgi:hypothetical protein
MFLNVSAMGLPSQRQFGSPAVPGGTFGELLDSKATPDYYTLAKNNRVFVLGAANVNPSAFTGAAAGTPLLGLYNPANSGVDLVMLMLRLNVRSTGTAAQTGQGFAFWAANQGGVAPTGTQTVARSAYSQALTGSMAYGMVNVANTGAVASAIIAPSISVGAPTTTPGVNVGVLVDEIKGSIIIAPGSYLAFGAYQAMTAGLLDVALTWAEIPA